MAGRLDLVFLVSTLTRRLVSLAKALFGFGSSLSVCWTFIFLLLRSSIWFCPVILSPSLSPTLLDPLGVPGLSRCHSTLAMEVWNPGIGEIIVELQTEQICFWPMADPSKKELETIVSLCCKVLIAGYRHQGSPSGSWLTLLNRLLELYGRELFRAGRPYNHYAETLNAVSSRRPRLRRCLQQAWNLACGVAVAVLGSTTDYVVVLGLAPMLQESLPCLGVVWQGLVKLPQLFGRTSCFHLILDGLLAMCSCKSPNPKHVTRRQGIKLPESTAHTWWGWLNWLFGTLLQLTLSSLFRVRHYEDVLGSSWKFWVFLAHLETVAVGSTLAVYELEGPHGFFWPAKIQNWLEDEDGGWTAEPWKFIFGGVLRFNFCHLWITEPGNLYSTLWPFSPRF